MVEITKKNVLACLEQIKGPDATGNIVSLGLVSEIFITDGKVVFSITIPGDRAQELESLRRVAEQTVKSIDGVSSVVVAVTAERKAGDLSPIVRPKFSSSSPMNRTENRSNYGKPHGKLPKKEPIEGVKSIIAIASGKGGVGKSTTAVNLALALRALGKRTGILDADIYGPSMPRLLGITDRPQSNKQGIIKPIEKFGLKIMSIGFMIEEETPIVWRGPMVMSALTQMIKKVAWGELDILLADMPPGTGDAQLTLAQSVPLSGAVIVSTPQDLALIDARRGFSMFRKVEVPILGIIENMSTFLCPKCGEHSAIFGHGGAQEEAAKKNVPFLGNIPLHMEIRIQSDAGRPVLISDPDSEHAKIYADIARKIVKQLENSL